MHFRLGICRHLPWCCRYNNQSQDQRDGQNRTDQIHGTDCRGRTIVDGGAFFAGDYTSYPDH